MNAWEPPKLSDLKATPAPVRRARSTFDVLGDPHVSEEELARQELAAIGHTANLIDTERMLVGGRMLDVITSSPPPVRREASPPTVDVPATPSYASAAAPPVEHEDEGFDDLFDAWTVEPPARRDEAPHGKRRGVLVAGGLVVGAVALALWAWSASTSATVAAVDAGPAMAPQAAAVIPAGDVASADEVRPSVPDVAEPLPPVPAIADPAPVDATALAEEPAAEGAISVEPSSPPIAAPSAPARAPTPAAAAPAPGVDRTTMYTPQAEEPEPVEVPEAAPVEAPTPALAPRPETTGTNPWGEPAAQPAPEVVPTGTNPWGVQE